MRFQELSNELLAQKIGEIVQGKGFRHGYNSGYEPYFQTLYLLAEKEIALTKTYHPYSEYPSLFSQINSLMRVNTEQLARVREKLCSKGCLGSGVPYVSNSPASLKLHISLNNISDMDESVILGLIELLVTEIIENDQLSFSIKIIKPENLNVKADKSAERFQNTDQITLYFDPSSSIASFINLAKKIESYLEQYIVNQVSLGPKDSWALNAFVSARFDTNRLNSRYSVFAFFDEELKKFFTLHQGEYFGLAPLCALETVFNVVICNESIVNLDRLNREESHLIQKEITKAMQNPKEYMIDALKAVEPKFKKAPLKQGVDLNGYVEKIKAHTFDLSQCTSLKELEQQVGHEQATLYELTTSFQDAQKEAFCFDITVFEAFGFHLTEKRAELHALAMKQKYKIEAKIIADSVKSFFPKAEEEQNNYGILIQQALTKQTP